MDEDRTDVQAERLMQVLEGLLALDAISLDDAMARASQLIPVPPARRAGRYATPGMVAPAW